MSISEFGSIQAESKIGSEPDSISTKKYNLIIGGLLFYGFALNALIVEALGPLLYGGKKFIFVIIAYIASAVVGGILSASESPIKSFIGYNLVVLPIGLVFASFMSGVEIKLLMTAIIVTGIATLLILGLATLFPEFFKKIGRTLFVCLIIGIVVQAVSVNVFHKGDNVINWAFTVLFTFYIGYDWSRAQSYPKTLDNAIDATTALYMDIAILFVKIFLMLLTSRKNDD